MARRGMLTNEPEPIDREISQILTKMFRALRDAGISKGKIAHDLGIPDRELDQLVFGLAFIGSAVSDTGGALLKTSFKPDLKLID